MLSSLSFVPMADAALVLMLDDPNDNAAAVSIQDLTANDLNGAAGALTYIGSVGAFNVNVTTGISKPLIGPSKLDLNSLNVSGAAGTLIVSLTDTDFVDTFSAYRASFGGTTSGTVVFDFLLDDGNNEFSGQSFATDTVVAVGDNSVFSNELTAYTSGTDPYSLSIITNITHSDAMEVTSFDAIVTPVPVPASGLLFLSAAGGLDLMRKKRKSK